MAFLETPRFPELISHGAKGGPGYATVVTATASGNEYRNQPWSQARHTYDVAHAARDFDEFKTLKAFFVIANGRTNGFRYKDWTDYTVSAGEGLVSLLGGSPDEWQLYKRYTVGLTHVDRIIVKPVSAITVTGGGTYSVDYTTGIVSRVSGANPTGWTGEFDVPARFDVDQMNAQIIDGRKDAWIMGWDSIPIVELRNP